MEAVGVYAQDMTEFLKRSALPERKVFIEAFVRETVVMSGKAVVGHNVPMPDDSPTPGADSEEFLQGGSVTSAAGGV